MRRTLRRIIAGIAAVAALATLPAPASAHSEFAPFCGIYWGSLEESAGQLSQAKLTDVRAGRHPCFDRLVFDFKGDVDGYRASYVDNVRQAGSGKAVPVGGEASLEMVALSPSYNDNGRQTYRPDNRRELVDVAGWDTFRQVAWASSFEGETTIALGVRARLPFRVFTLDGPASGSRLVIDVAHHW